MSEIAYEVWIYSGDELRLRFPFEDAVTALRYLEVQSAIWPALGLPTRRGEVHDYLEREIHRINRETGMWESEPMGDAA